MTRAPGSLRQRCLTPTTTATVPGVEKSGPGGESGGAEETRAVGWHADPFGRFSQRWWTGGSWSERVMTSENTQALDPPILVAAPFAGLEELPAKPLNAEVSLPLEEPSSAPLVVWWIGLAVFVLLIVLIVMSAIALS